jgi:hypothetical protein
MDGRWAVEKNRGEKSREIDGGAQYRFDQSKLNT